MSALERRESVVRAAIAAFAIAGYHGTSTAAIARRVGVTQPYLFRLFPDKKAIFVAALMRSAEDTRLAFEGAADGAEGGERALQAMTNAYAQLTVHLPLGADADRTAGFFACGMLGNALAAMGLPPNAGRQGSVQEGRGVSACLPRRAGRSPWAR
ncbi:TetR/AcrR family transcriptional regulator [Streptomyces sp. NPDC096205]|uniref:TetR/AcrR family transcriptional regulator n=1 Tax=Streptomyces sp. NPDC096205 TaxID=3366081 RepID=UPI0037F102C4